VCQRPRGGRAIEGPQRLFMPATKVARRAYCNQCNDTLMLHAACSTHAHMDWLSAFPMGPETPPLECECPESRCRRTCHPRCLHFLPWLLPRDDLARAKRVISKNLEHLFLNSFNLMSGDETTELTVSCGWASALGHLTLPQTGSPALPRAGHCVRAPNTVVLTAQSRSRG
jgi:hypothetical protein